MITNCLALAKLAVNKKLNTVRLLVTFDRTAHAITVRNAAYVSGDLCDVNYEHKDAIVAQEVERAKNVLRTDNIVFAM